MSELRIEPSVDPTVASRLDAIAERLDSYVARYERARDSRCVFAYAYAIMTRRIRDEIHLSGLADPEWVVALAEAFAARYFQALDDFDQNEPLSPAWDKVFRAILDRRTSVLEDLLFGITAHIVHDLPLALVDVGLTTNGRSHIHDFHAINEMMSGTIDTMQDQVARRYGPVIYWLDRMVESYDEILTNYGIRMSRGLAWYNADRLLDPDSIEDAKAAIEKNPMIVVDAVMNPPFWSLRIILRGVRWLIALLRSWPKTPALETDDLS
jgi:hypothetical protein